MFTVQTPRGEIRVPARALANAADRLWRFTGHRQANAGTKARKRLDQRDSVRDAATVLAVQNLVRDRLAA